MRLAVGVAHVVQLVAYSGEQVFHPGPLLDLGVWRWADRRRGIVRPLQTQGGGGGRLGRQLLDEDSELAPGEPVARPPEVAQVDPEEAMQVGL